MKKEVEIEAKTLQIYMKVRDEFAANLLDQDNDFIRGYEGYVPGFMPGEHFGDYLILDIDIDTGLITNWVKPDEDDIQNFVNGSEDD